MKIILALFITIILYHFPLWLAWVNVNRFSRKIDQVTVGAIWLYCGWLGWVGYRFITG